MWLLLLLQDIILLLLPLPLKMRGEREEERTKLDPCLSTPLKAVERGGKKRLFGSGRKEEVLQILSLSSSSSPFLFCSHLLSTTSKQERERKMGQGFLLRFLV